jgi:hypothetical protein
MGADALVRTSLADTVAWKKRASRRRRSSGLSLLVPSKRLTF